MQNVEGAHTAVFRFVFKSQGRIKVLKTRRIVRPVLLTRYRKGVEVEAEDGCGAVGQVWEGHWRKNVSWAVYATKPLCAVDSYLIACSDEKHAGKTISRCPR